MKLDFNLKTPEERGAYVQSLLDAAPPDSFSEKELETMSEYILYAYPTKELREAGIITNNRMKTINKRETSYEGICSSFENGEDGVYNIISDLGRQTILDPKDPITEKDIAEIPALAALVKSIAEVEEELKTATGRRRFLLKRQLIEMHQDQYVIRNEYRGKWSGSHNGSRLCRTIAHMDLSGDITIDEKGEPHDSSIISLFEPTHIEALLCNYNSLKTVSAGQFQDDLYYLMWSLDDLIAETLPSGSLYARLIEYKIAGRKNAEIQSLLFEEFGIKHSIEYISALWRNKIPKMIAERAKEDYLIWYYTFKEKGQWKRCSCCGEIKLAHNKFFSRNNTAKSGFYSLCKDCRNKRAKEKREGGNV